MTYAEIFPCRKNASCRTLGGVSPEELSDSIRESTCTVANLLTLDPNSRPRLSSRPFEPSREIEGSANAAWTLADARHARIRRLAPCLRHHLLDDGWFEFVRRIHRRIAENPWIPLEKNDLSNVSSSVSPTMGRSSARSFPDLRYSSLDLLTVVRRVRTWSKFKLRIPCTDLWLLVFHIRESCKSNLWHVIDA